MIGDETQATYDRFAAHYATINAAMAPELAAAAGRFLQLAGPAARVLDVGCGAGRDVAWMEVRGATVSGADLSLGMLAQARLQARGPLLQMDMRCLALRPSQFQGVWCCASLLHLPKHEAPRALAEIQRVLVPGALLFLAVQEGTGQSWESCPYAEGKRLFARYTQAEMVDMLTQEGFTILASASNKAGSRHWLHFFATSDGNHVCGQRSR
jgi:ubiquinone/menaquinone biosynthesis C-methylase UbiE